MLVFYSNFTIDYMGVGNCNKL